MAKTTKETQKTQVLVLDTLDVKNLTEFKGFEKTQLELLNKNPLFDIKDTETYEAAKKSRTTLRTARTALEGQEKTIVKKITAFRKDIGALTGGLIGITQKREKEFQDRIKEYENKNSMIFTPVVALTASVLETDKEMFINAGMDGFVGKPIDTDELESELSRFLDKK